MRLRSKRMISMVLLLGIVLGTVIPASIVVAADAEQQVQFAPPVMVVNSSFLNVRTGPGIQYPVLLTVVGGTQLPVLGRSGDGVWFQVSTVVGAGWVNAQYVIPRGSFTNVPVVNTSLFAFVAAPPIAISLPNLGDQGGGAPIAAAVTSPGGTFTGLFDANNNPISVSPNERFRAVINVEAVDLRTQPSEGASSLTTIFRDDTRDYPIVGNAKDSRGVEWFAIIYPNVGTGWIEAPKLLVRLSGAFRTVMVVTTDSIGLGDGPGTGSSTLPTVVRGAEGFLVNVTQDGRFIQIELGSGEVGWLPFEAAVGRTGTTTDGLNLPSVPLNFAGVPILSDQGGGLPIVPVVPAQPNFGLNTPHIVVNTAFLNIRSGPGAQFTSIATVPGGSEFQVLGIASDRVWFLIQGYFGRGWVNNEFTIFRGVINSVPEIPLDTVIGVLSAPTALIQGPITVYLAPGVNFGAVGIVTGPAELPILARTADFAWVQLNTTLGIGWVLSSQVILSGDTAAIPIVS